MNFSIATAPGKIADPAVRTNPPHAPPARPSPLPAEAPAARPAAVPDAAIEASRPDVEREQELETELAAANYKLAGDGHEVRFEYDRDAKLLIVRLIEVGTDKVLRQFPTDEALRAARLVKSGKPLINMQA